MSDKTNFRVVQLDLALREVKLLRAQLAEAERERDEAVALLRGAFPLLDRDDHEDTCTRISTTAPATGAGSTTRLPPSLPSTPPRGQEASDGE